MFFRFLLSPMGIREGVVPSFYDARIRSPDRPARSQSQYRLSYRAQYMKVCIILNLTLCEVIRIIGTLNGGSFLCSLKNTSSCVRVPVISTRNNRVRGRSHSPFLSRTQEQNRAHLPHWTHNPICHGPQSVLPLTVCCIHGVMLIDSPLRAPHKEIPLQNSCVISNHPHLI